MRTIYHLLVLCLLATLAGVAVAEDPGACEDDIGIGFGLCTAYCDATDCDCGYDPECEPMAAPVACRNILISYGFVTGHALACGDVCPCIDPNGWTNPGSFNIWNDLASGEQPATSCIDSPSVITLEFAPQFPNVGPTKRASVTASSCTVFLSQPVVNESFDFPLTGDQARRCRDLLEAQIADQGLVCD